MAGLATAGLGAATTVYGAIQAPRERRRAARAEQASFDAQRRSLAIKEEKRRMTPGEALDRNQLRGNFRIQASGQLTDAQKTGNALNLQNQQRIQGQSFATEDDKRKRSLAQRGIGSTPAGVFAGQQASNDQSRRRDALLLQQAQLASGQQQQNLAAGNAGLLNLANQATGERRFEAGQLVGDDLTAGFEANRAALHQGNANEFNALTSSGLDQIASGIDSAWVFENGAWVPRPRS